MPLSVLDRIFDTDTVGDNGIVLSGVGFAMFKTIAKLLGFSPLTGPEGLHLEYVSGYWELEGRTDFPAFLRAQPTLIPPSALLYLEDGSPSGELEEWLHRNTVQPSDQIVRGSYGLSTAAFHIPLTAINIGELAMLAERVASPELAIHVHVYEPGRMILEWHDAFNNHILIDGRIKGSEVADFARTLGFSLTRQMSELDAAP